MEGEINRDANLVLGFTNYQVGDFLDSILHHEHDWMDKYLPRASRTVGRRCPSFDYLEQDLNDSDSWDFGFPISADKGRIDINIRREFN